MVGISVSILTQAYTIRGGFRKVAGGFKWSFVMGMGMVGEDRDRWTDKRSANGFNRLAGLDERHTSNHLCVVCIHLSSYNSLVQILSRRL